MANHISEKQQCAAVYVGHQYKLVRDKHFSCLFLYRKNKLLLWITIIIIIFPCKIWRIYYNTPMNGTRWVWCSHSSNQTVASQTQPLISFPRYKHCQQCLWWRGKAARNWSLQWMVSVFPLSLLGIDVFENSHFPVCNTLDCHCWCKEWSLFWFI